MKIVIKTKNIQLTSDLKNYIYEKIGSLEKFSRIFSADEWRHRNFLRKAKEAAEIWVEVGKETEHHQKGMLFRAEAQMRLPGKSIRAESVTDDLKVSIVAVKDELQREIKKYRAKISSVEKREQRILKKELHLSPSARFYRKGRIREEG